MATGVTGPPRGPPRVPPRDALRLLTLGRGDERWKEGLWRQAQLRGPSEDESTPLNVRAQVAIDLSTVFGGSKVKRRKDSKMPKRRAHYGPEDHIKIFAFRIAIIEKAASAIGTLAFIFASTVILGGFATSLAYADFWVVVVIILAEALRIFTRSHELEWQLISSRMKESTKSASTESTSKPSVLPIPAGGDVESQSNARPGGVQPPVSNSKSVPQTYSALSETDLSEVSVVSRAIPVLGRVKPWMMSGFLYTLQLVSAITSIGLAMWRLSEQEFCFKFNGQQPGETRCPNYLDNVKVCMNVFFILVLLEASLFLLEKGYFEYRMTYKQLLIIAQRDLFKEEKKASSLLEAKEVDSSIFRKFYYTVYTTCLKGSTLNGLHMNLVAFGLQWLQSDDFEQQLHGARLLNKFVSPRAKGKESETEVDVAESQTEEALTRLGRTPGVIERLVEVLFWNSDHELEEELVCEVASVVECLVAHDHNWSRFNVIPGALDAVVSILLPHSNVDVLSEKESWAAYSKQLHLQLMGVKILRGLCRSYANSLQIGETRGLLSILVLFIQPQGNAPRYVGDAGRGRPSGCPDGDDGKFAKARGKIYKTSLQVILYLAANKSNSGGTMRQQIAGIVSILKNLRDTIELCKDRPHLQLLSMEILYYLTIEDVVRSAIGATGGTIRLLLDLFRENDAVQSRKPGNMRLSEDKGNVKQDLAKCAGKVLSRLMIESKENCVTLLTLKDKDGSKPLVQVMTESFCLGDEEIVVSAAEILCRTMKYADENTKREIAACCGLQALQNISEIVEVKSFTYEVSLGLASRVMLALPPDGENDALSKGIERAKRGAFLSQLVRNLHHSPSTSKVPKIRRYSLEVMIALMERDEYFLNAFARLDLKTELEQTLDTISEVENFTMFLGLTAYARQSEDIRSLVRRCMAPMNDDVGST